MLTLLNYFACDQELCYLKFVNPLYVRQYFLYFFVSILVSGGIKKLKSLRNCTKYTCIVVRHEIGF